MPERLKIKFISAIWGARYIHEFSSLSLPSYMADGNIPALAAGNDIEFIFLTSSESRPVFDDLEIFSELEKFGPVRFILIDDLITSGIYGVTLTLAYARAIRSTGSEQTETHFVFMNSDFVLADGSLAGLARAMREGHRCIVAPSLRARAEDMIPALKEAIDPSSGHLAMPPRAMVRLALGALHGTVVGKTVSQRFVTASTHNQLYWGVDPGTLLVRHFLIFMLMIKPERPLGPVNSYCDYGFIPEMVPSSTFHVMSDSDDFFMLELQAAKQELEFLSGGMKPPVEIAAELEGWTTREHRRFATVDCVFHAGNLPPNLDAERKKFAAFANQVQALLKAPPVDHVYHHYWYNGLQAWAARKFVGTPDQIVWPPEVAQAGPDEASGGGGAGAGSATLPPQADVAGKGLWQRLLTVGRRMYGAAPFVPIWRADSLEWRLALDWFNKHTMAGHRILLVCSEASPLNRLSARFPQIAIARLPGIAGASLRPQGQAADMCYDAVFVHVYPDTLYAVGPCLDAARAVSGPGTQIGVFIQQTYVDLNPTNFTSAVAYAATGFLPGDWLGRSITATYVGGVFRGWVRLIQLRLIAMLVEQKDGSGMRKILAAVLMPPVALLAAFCNRRARLEAGSAPLYASCVLAEFSAPFNSTDQAPASATAGAM